MSTRCVYCQMDSMHHSDTNSTIKDKHVLFALEPVTAAAYLTMVGLLLSFDLSILVLLHAQRAATKDHRLASISRCKTDFYICIMHRVSLGLACQIVIRQAKFDA